MLFRLIEFLDELSVYFYVKIFKANEVDFSGYADANSSYSTG